MRIVKDKLIVIASIAIAIAVTNSVITVGRTVAATAITDTAIAIAAVGDTVYGCFGKVDFVATGLFCVWRHRIGGVAFSRALPSLSYGASRGAASFIGALALRFSPLYFQWFVSGA